MTWKEPDLPALRELESAVIRLWRAHPAMNDYSAGRAYDGAYQHYRATARGREPRPSTLTGLDLEILNAVKEACEKLLHTGASPVKGMPEGNTQPINHEKLLEYLRELTRSVELHTQLGGRTGYLEFVQSFLHA
ncbi:MAG TPA: hypothetical protein VFZ59_02260 [Verrucomicrobiae bacterium]|nr:hypothetical protein [Verrucomicrobiae bacterium]